jgi:hypothetical protein
MKVWVAARVFSNSVADAIDTCRDELKLPAFKGSEATSRFIRVVNDTFDLLNARDLRAWEP